MFGYIRPFKAEMLVKEYELYKSVYCGLCRKLGKSYGVFSRLILSYDSTFLALVASAVAKGDTELQIEHKHCTCNPFKRCSYCSCANNSLELASAFSVISYYYKLKDTVHDENFFKATCARFLLILAYHNRKKAAGKYPEVDSAVREMLKKQFEAESIEDCSVDRAAHPTAEMLSRIMVALADNETEKAVYSEFGYFLGRWVYIIDASDDFDKDRKKGSFNPIVSRFRDIDNASLENEKVRTCCNELLNQTMAQLIAAYNLMTFSNFNSIIDNIVNKGMPEMQRKVIFDRESNHKNSKV